MALACLEPAGMLDCINSQHNELTYNTMNATEHTKYTIPMKTQQIMQAEAVISEVIKGAF